MDEFPTAAAIESLFRDAYQILEEIQGSAEQLEPVTETIAVCHWTIQNLERLHRTQARTNASNLSHDAFDISRNLERFIASCSALTYSLSPPMSSSEIGCMFGGPRQTRKRNQVRELQEEFWDHQRMLSMVLANAIYMTTLDMQREKSSPDPTLASILRLSQKRHTIYERCDDKGHEAKSQKPTESRADHLEWEFCVRRYFDYVETQIRAALQKEQAYEVQLARRVSEPCLALAAPIRSSRTMTTTSNFSYSSYRRGEALNTESRTRRLSVEGDPYNAIYTRSRRGSTASNLSNSEAGSRTNSFTSSRGGSPTISPSAIGFLKPAPSMPYDRDQTIGQTLTHPRANGGDTLEQAWNDIMNATRDMSANEARAYTQGRLEGLNPALTAQLRHMGGNRVPTTQTPLRQNSAPLPSRLSRAPGPEELMDGIPDEPLDLQQRRSQILRVTNPENKRSAVPKAVRANTLPVHAQKRLPRRSSKKGLASLRSDHQRQLSTITERPMTAGSKKSRAESTKSRKSIFSLRKEKPPPLPEMPDFPRIILENRKASDSSLSDSSTLRGSTPDKNPRIVELDSSPSQTVIRPTTRPATQKSNLSKRLNLASKPLPMRPDQFPLPTINEPAENHGYNPIKKFSRLFSWGKQKKNPHTSLTSMSTPQLVNAMRSAETLQIGSLDGLSRRNGSKSTLCLVAIQEGPDQPFSIWLNALPYIEGRCPTPRG